MKASPAARSWIAAGVRHELLMRAFPALRHDMATPVSVIRMALLLLKSQASVPTFDAATWKERTELIEGQVAALGAGVRSLRNWELTVDEEGITRSALVTQCAAMMRTPFELGSIKLHVGPGLVPRADEPRFPSSAALRYMLLGALGYLHDSEPQPAAIHVADEGADALRFTATRGTSEAGDPLAVAQRAPRSLAIDSIALQALADGLGYAVEVERDAVRFALSSQCSSPGI
ncbi:MAG: hypothetical protein EOP82_17090 [Variovorax sp.]|nr:MAG: hypothetical protein EOP82_17090 [Variovorax sp.]